MPLRVVTPQEIKPRHQPKVTRSRATAARSVSPFGSHPEFYGGASELDRLDWAINATYNGKESLKDSEFQVNFAVFCGLAFPPFLSESGKSNLPLDQARLILRRFNRIIGRAVNRQNIFIKKDVVVHHLIWEADRKRFSLAPEGSNFVDIATVNLLRLIRKYGHLIMRCDAPAAHLISKCGKWFLARRTDQRFCSKQCTSRVTSKRHRDKKIHAEAWFF
jgi:predicted nucleic acid-binding Zn ribbon protein